MSCTSVGLGIVMFDADVLGGVALGELSSEMQAYLDYLLLKNRPRTARAAGFALVQFARWCDGAGVAPLRATRAQLDAYLGWLTAEYLTPAGKPLARSTVATRIANLKSWYAWLDLRRVVVADPASHLRVRVKRSRQVVHEHLTLQEATALLETAAAHTEDYREGTHRWAVQIRNVALFAVAIASGRRVGGLIDLRVDQINLDRSELRVEREKGRVGRVLPVAEWATALVGDYLQRARPLLAADGNPWLFPGRRGRGQVTNKALDFALTGAVQRTIDQNPDLEELARKAISWHSLRVTFATLLFSNGCPIRSVNELMLHRELTTTARYTPIPIEDMQDVWRSAHPRP